MLEIPLLFFLYIFSCRPGEYEIQYGGALTKECAIAAQTQKLHWRIIPEVPFDDYETYILIHQPPPGDYYVQLTVPGTVCAGEIRFHE